MKENTKQFFRMKECLLQHAEFIADGQDVIDKKTGEVVTHQQFSEKLADLEGKPQESNDNEGYRIADEYGKIYQHPRFKHRNNLERTAKLLGITNRKCEHLNRIYRAADSMGIVEASKKTRKTLGKDYRRTLSRRTEDDWIKPVTLSGYIIGESSADFWMMNPKFTIARDVWNTKRQQWMKDCFNSGVVTKYELAGCLPKTDLILEEDQQSTDRKERIDTLFLNSEVDEFTAYSKRRRSEGVSKSLKLEGANNYHQCS